MEHKISTNNVLKLFPREFSKSKIKFHILSKHTYTHTLEHRNMNAVLILLYKMGGQKYKGVVKNVYGNFSYKIVFTRKFSDPNTFFRSSYQAGVLLMEESTIPSLSNIFYSIMIYLLKR